MNRSLRKTKHYAKLCWMQSYFRHGFIILFIFLAAACSEQGRLQPLAADAVILAFGDSLTYGKGASRNSSYPAVLQKLTGRTVINAGISGELSKEGLQRLPALLDNHRPALLILTHGGNDMLRRHNLAIAADNLRAMIAMARGKGIDVVMLGVPNPGLLLSPAQFYETVAAETGVPADLDVISDVLQYPANKSDAVHPNAMGYRIMAERIVELLEDEGAL
jgi:lysophospholipase L1-like esterase